MKHYFVVFLSLVIFLSASFEVYSHSQSGYFTLSAYGSGAPYNQSNPDNGYYDNHFTASVQARDPLPQDPGGAYLIHHYDATLNSSNQGSLDKWNLQLFYIRSGPTKNISDQSHSSHRHTAASSTHWERGNLNDFSMVKGNNHILFSFRYEVYNRLTNRHAYTVYPSRNRYNF